MMRTKRTITTLLALLLGSFMTAGAASKDFVWDGGGVGNSWTTPENWDQDLSYPKTKDDKATIDLTTAVTVDYDLSGATQPLGELIIGEKAIVRLLGSANGALRLQADGTENGQLTIQADATDFGKLHVEVADIKLRLDGAVTHQIGGELKLFLSGSKIGVNNDITFAKFSTFTGSIVGAHNDAAIEITRGKTLKNQISIEGQMTIKAVGAGMSNGTFTNEGSVVANAVGTLLLDAGVTLNDGLSTYTWEAVVEDAVMQFKEAATGLSGDFILDNCGIFDVDANITTCGALEDTGGGARSGTVDASAANVCFDWNCTGDPTRICDSNTTGDCQ